MYGKNNQTPEFKTFMPEITLGRKQVEKLILKAIAGAGVEYNLDLQRDDIHVVLILAALIELLKEHGIQAPYSLERGPEGVIK